MSLYLTICSCFVLNYTHSLIIWDVVDGAWPAVGNRFTPIHFKQSVGWPVSRVLSPPRGAMDGHSSGTPVTGRLARPTRRAVRKPTRGPKPPALPIRSCSRWGLPCHPRRRERGALLPHPFTLTRGHRPKPVRAGGLLSVALSLGLPPPGVTRHRVSVEPGLSSPCRFPYCKEQPSGHPTPDHYRTETATCESS